MEQEQNRPLNPPLPTKIRDQYSDFLLRSVDPYAQAKYELLHEQLPHLRGQRCLVIGVGSGEFACQLAQKGAAVTAVDIDDTSLALCRKTAETLGVSLIYRVSTLENLREEEPYDLVVATDVIEHIEDDKHAVEKILAFTKPGGKIVITVPALNALFGHHDRILGHFRRYTQGQVQKLFAGKSDTLFLRYFGFLLIPVTLLYSVILKKSYPVAEVGGEMNKGSRMGDLLRTLFKVEKKVSLPLGTSVLAVFRKH